MSLTGFFRAVPLTFLAGVLVNCGPKTPAPEVEYSHCWAVYMRSSGPVCALRTDLHLMLWVREPAGAAVRIAAGDRSLPATGDEVQGGRRVEVSIPPGAKSLEVWLRQPDGTRSRSWSLALSAPEAPPWLGDIGRLAKINIQEAQQRLIQIQKSAPRKDQGVVLRSLGLVALQRGHDMEAISFFQRGIEADRTEKNLSGEIEKKTLLARVYLNQGRFNDVRQILPAWPLPPGAPAMSKYQAAFYQGLLADNIGDYRSALKDLRQAADLAERVGEKGFRWNAEQTEARLLQDLGRTTESFALFGKLLSELDRDRRNELGLMPSDRGVLLSNFSWGMLLAREGEDDPRGNPTPMLREALTIFESRGRPEQRLNARLNLALSQQQDGRWDEAGQTLVEARLLAPHASLRQRLWWSDLEGRQATAEGHAARALQLYDELARMAEQGLSFEARFRAALGRARTHIALDQRAAALSDLAEADRLVEEQSLHVPVNEGRDTLVAQRGVATRLYLELLLADDQPHEAFALVRRARSRLLRQLAIADRLTHLKPEEQASWEQALAKYLATRKAVELQAGQGWRRQERHGDRSAELAQAREDLDRVLADLGALARVEEGSLSDPAPDEVILAYHPLRQGWIGFAAHGQEVEVRRFQLAPGSLPNPRELAHLLLTPFRQAIEGAHRVRILPYGPLQSVDFHALPFFGDEPLLARRAVVYSLDLPVRPLPTDAGRPLALLVSDPEGNLPAARLEATEVAKAIGTWRPGWAFKKLGIGASAGTVRKVLQGASLFHFAGHGTFAGLSGWDSELHLADGAPLTLGDLLTLRKAPAWVVLSACEGGRSSDRAPGEGIGLAQAFLLAGSQAVVAATRPVPDRTARVLVRELYLRWKPGIDLPSQLQRAQLACFGQAPVADCASFRLFVP